MRFARAISVALFALLAGCFAAVGPDALHLPPLLQGTGALVVADVGAGARLDASPRGPLLVCASGSGTRDAQALVSLDGRNWSAVQPLGLARAMECDPAASADGALHVAFVAEGAVALASSFDDGASWRLQPVGAPAAPARGRPWLVADEGRLHLVTQTLTPPVRVFLATSPDEGRTWNETELPLAAGPLDDVLVGEPQAEGDRLAVPYVARASPLAASSLALRLLESDDLGATWRDTLVRDEALAAPFVPAAARVDGQVVLPYPTRAPEGGGTALATAVVFDGNTTEGPLLFPNETMGPMPAFALDAREDGVYTVALHVAAEDGAWQVALVRVAHERVGPQRAESQASHAPGGPVDGVALRHDAQGLARVLFPARENRCATTPAPAPPVGHCLYLMSERPLGP